MCSPVWIDRQDGVPRPDWSEISHSVKWLNVKSCYLAVIVIMLSEGYCVYEYFDEHYIRKGLRSEHGLNRYVWPFPIGAS